MYSQNGIVEPSKIDEDAFRMFEEIDPAFCYRNINFLPSNLRKKIFGDNTKDFSKDKEIA